MAQWYEAAYFTMAEVGVQVQIPEGKLAGFFCFCFCFFFVFFFPSWYFYPLAYFRLFSISLFSFARFLGKRISSPVLILLISYFSWASIY